MPLIPIEPGIHHEDESRIALRHNVARLFSMTGAVVESIDGRDAPGAIDYVSLRKVWSESVPYIDMPENGESVRPNHLSVGDLKHALDRTPEIVPPKTIRKRAVGFIMRILNGPGEMPYVRLRSNDFIQHEQSYEATIEGDEPIRLGVRQVSFEGTIDIGLPHRTAGRPKTFDAQHNVIYTTMLARPQVTGYWGVGVQRIYASRPLVGTYAYPELPSGAIKMPPSEQFSEVELMNQVVATLIENHTQQLEAAQQQQQID